LAETIVRTPVRAGRNVCRYEPDANYARARPGAMKDGMPMLLCAPVWVGPGDTEASITPGSVAGVRLHPTFQQPYSNHPRPCMKTIRIVYKCYSF
jgi:hypothetical protein